MPTLKYLSPEWTAEVAHRLRDDVQLSARGRGDRVGLPTSVRRTFEVRYIFLTRLMMRGCLGGFGLGLVFMDGAIRVVGR